MELIDGERLVGLFENHELGLKPGTVFEPVPEFFRSFESPSRQLNTLCIRFAPLPPQQPQHQLPCLQLSHLFGMHVLRGLPVVELPQRVQELRLRRVSDVIGMVAVVGAHEVCAVPGDVGAAFLVRGGEACALLHGRNDRLLQGRHGVQMRFGVQRGGADPLVPYGCPFFSRRRIGGHEAARPVREPGVGRVAVIVVMRRRRIGPGGLHAEGLTMGMRQRRQEAQFEVIPRAHDHGRGREDDPIVL